MPGKSRVAARIELKASLRMDQILLGREQPFWVDNQHNVAETKPKPTHRKVR
jgi:hypothetical protein